MAIIHQATLTPSKPELIAAYLPTVDEFAVDVDPIEHLGAYRFDDPAGQVGIESHLVRVTDGRTIHLPLTYRNDPLPDAEEWLVGTLKHSVLGTRHVYDAVGDPVYIAELVRIIATGGQQAPLMVQTPDGEIERETTTVVAGTGSATEGPTIAAGAAVREGTATSISLGQRAVIVHHAPVPGEISGAALTGTWPGSATPSALAELMVS